MTPNPDSPEFTTRELAPGERIAGFWGAADILLPAGQRGGRYLAGFAASDRCIRAAQRLRFEVFNLELNEGLAESHATGLDRDRFDAQMTHLVLLDRPTGAIIGTYRLQTAREGLAAGGIYSAQVFDLAGLEPWHDRAIECGRACIARDHRSVAALLALWLGIRAFMTDRRSRWLFGCCSLTTQDPMDGWRAMRTIRRGGHDHPELRLAALPTHTCRTPDGREPDLGAAEPLGLPKLFATYMRLGAKVVSEPAIDREFGTVDFLILMDGDAVALSSLA